MEITNELLAAYAEGNVTPEERKAVREYLTEHPSQLESVMMMMDEDYGMEVKQHVKDISFMGATYIKKTLSPSVPSVSSDSIEFYLGNGNRQKRQSEFFNQSLNDLLDDIY